MDSPDNPAAPALDASVPAPHDQYAHLRSPNHKRGRGVPFRKSTDLRRLGFKGPQVKLEKRTTSALLHEITTNVLLSPSPTQEERGRKVCRMIAIIETLADKAERGDNDAAEILLDRFGGKVRSGDDLPSESSGRVTIEWNGPPPPWAPRAILDAQTPALAPAEQTPSGMSLKRGPEATTAPDVIDAEVCGVEDASEKG